MNVYIFHLLFLITKLLILCYLIWSYVSVRKWNEIVSGCWCGLRVLHSTVFVYFVLVNVTFLYFLPLHVFLLYFSLRTCLLLYFLFVQIFFLYFSDRTHVLYCHSVHVFFCIVCLCRFTFIVFLLYFLVFFARTGFLLYFVLIQIFHCFFSSYRCSFPRLLERPTWSMRRVAVYNFVCPVCPCTNA